MTTTRPVSLTSHISTVMGSILRDYSHLEQFTLITQQRFMVGRACLTHLSPFWLQFGMLGRRVSLGYSLHGILVCVAS